VDEIMRHLQSTLAQAPIVRVRALSMRMGLVGPLEPASQPRHRQLIEQEVVMAKVIEFMYRRTLGNVEVCPCAATAERS